MKLKNFVHYCKEAAQGVLGNGWMMVASVTVIGPYPADAGHFCHYQSQRNANHRRNKRTSGAQIVYLEDEVDHQYVAADTGTGLHCPPHPCQQGRGFAQ